MIEQDTYRDNSFRQLFDTYYDRVYKTAFYVTKDRFLAQDALQDTFIKAFRHQSEITDPAKMGAWLSVIATHTAIDLLRKRNRWNGIPTEDVYLYNETAMSEAASSVEEEVLTILQKERLDAHMTHLKPDYRQVLVLKYNEGLKDEEIAGMLRLNLGTVKSRIHRAKNQLKQLLQREHVKDDESR